MTKKRFALVVALLCLTAGAAVAADERGEVVEVTKDSFSLKTERDNAMFFNLTDDLTKGKVDPRDKFYPHSLKDLKVGQKLKVHYTSKNGINVALGVRIVEQPKPKAKAKADEEKRK